MKHTGRWVMILGGVLLAPACVHVRTPDVNINAGLAQDRVHSERVPPTASHEEARAELQRAYREIRRLEDENAKLRREKKEAERKAEACEDRYDKIEREYGD